VLLPLTAMWKWKEASPVCVKLRVVSWKATTKGGSAVKVINLDYLASNPLLPHVQEAMIEAI